MVFHIAVQEPLCNALSALISQILSRLDTAAAQFADDGARPALTSSSAVQTAARHLQRFRI
jgi:hypothetical protein